MTLLSAIFSGAVSLAFYVPEPAQNAEMVYCPLTKRLQPVHAFDVNQGKNELGEICLSAKQRDDFSSSILTKLSLGFSFSKQQSVEEIVFDYFKNGKSALDTVPDFPNHPERTFAENLYSLIGFGQNLDMQSVWKTEESFSLKLKARPPTKVLSTRFDFQISKNLETISRNINPRSPPVISA